MTEKVGFLVNNSSYFSNVIETLCFNINETNYSLGVAPIQKITQSKVTLYSQVINTGHEAGCSRNLFVSTWIVLNNPLSSDEHGFNKWISTILQSMDINLNTNSIITGNKIAFYKNRVQENFIHLLH